MKIPSNFRLAIAGIIVVAASGLVSYAVSAAMPDSLVPAGGTRYAAVGTGTEALTSDPMYTDLAGVSTNISIPSGKHGDVFVFFCGETWSTTSAAMVHAVIAGTASAPVQLREVEGTAARESQCANFFKLGVGAGTRNVKMQWASRDGNQQAMYQRSMFVVVNIH